MIGCNNGRSMENTTAPLLFHLSRSAFDNFSILEILMRLRFKIHKTYE